MATIASIFGANLGDTLWVTPLARYIPDLVVWMRLNDAKAEATSAILGHTCARLMQENPPETRKAPIRAHVTQQILAAYGHGGKPSIPAVVLRPDEINWGIAYLKDLLNGQTKVVGLVNHCSGSADPTNYRAAYVRGNPDVFPTIARFWKGAGYKVLQFGPAPGFYTPDVFTPIEGTIPVRGLTVRQLAAVYSVMGKLISLDTGDYHLMLSVGGRVACLTPPDSDQFGYRHWDLHYDAVCWGDERPRVQYIQHENWTEVLNTRLFSNMGGRDSV